MTLYGIITDRNQLLSLINVDGIDTFKQVVNQTYGYTVVEGKKTYLKGDELDDAINSAVLFDEISFDYSSINLMGVTFVDTQTAYKIKVSDALTVYYSTETGLKLKHERSVKEKRKTITTEYFYSNYQFVEGILVPMSINMVSPSIPIPGGINFNAKSIKFNVQTSDSDFE